MNKTPFIFVIFSVINNSDLDIQSHVALLGVLSLLVLFAVTFAGIVVPVIISLVLGIMSVTNARRVLKNKEATAKQRKRAKWGLIFSILAFLLLSFLCYWIFAGLG
jgi:uncharacterized membrane protein